MNIPFARKLVYELEDKLIKATKHSLKPSLPTPAITSLYPHVHPLLKRELAYKKGDKESPHVKSLPSPKACIEEVDAITFPDLKKRHEELAEPLPPLRKGFLHFLKNYDSLPSPIPKANLFPRGRIVQSEWDSSEFNLDEIADKINYLRTELKKRDSLTAWMVKNLAQTLIKKNTPLWYQLVSEYALLKSALFYEKFKRDRSETSYRLYSDLQETWEMRKHILLPEKERRKEFLEFISKPGAREVLEKSPIVVDSRRREEKPHPYLDHWYPMILRRPQLSLEYGVRRKTALHCSETHFQHPKYESFHTYISLREMHDWDGFLIIAIPCMLALLLILMRYWTDRNADRGSLIESPNPLERILNPRVRFYHESWSWEYWADADRRLFPEWRGLEEVRAKGFVEIQNMKDEFEEENWFVDRSAEGEAAFLE